MQQMTTYRDLDQKFSAAKSINRSSRPSLEVFGFRPDSLRWQVVPRVAKGVFDLFSFPHLQGHRFWVQQALRLLVYIGDKVVAQCG
eukprot:g65233.t1